MLYSIDDFSITFQAAIPVAVLVLKIQEFIKFIEIYWIIIA